MGSFSSNPLITTEGKEMKTNHLSLNKPGLRLFLWWKLRRTRGFKLVCYLLLTFTFFALPGACLLVCF